MTSAPSERLNGCSGIILSYFIRLLVETVRGDALDVKTTSSASLAVEHLKHDPS